jgi:CHAT domain-containing protein/tetratricopeptide (TPR) repeat protein
MFRRFRRKPQEKSVSPSVTPRPMLPAPEYDYDDDDTITPTMPLPAARPEIADAWLLEEDDISTPVATQRATFGDRPGPDLIREQVREHEQRPSQERQHASQPQWGQHSSRPASMPLPRSMPVDPEKVAHYLEEYLNASDWEASRAVVEDHPELLTNTALMLLRANMTRVAEQVGPAAAQTLARYLQALEVAQREGIEFAFETLPDPQKGLFAPDLDALLSRLESAQLANNPGERISICEMALPLAARDQNDELWAALQREIGINLPRLRYGDHAQHIERAIESLDAALQIFNREEYPADWAMTQHYLGIAFLQRNGANHASDIDQSIEILEAALEIRKRNVAPNDWAASQEALGSAYFLRTNGSRADNIDRSIAAFEAALQVRTFERSPFEWATDQLSLGNAYGQRTTGTRMGNIEQAITGFEAALTYFTCDTTPEQWALIHHNLGVAYMDRQLGNRGDNVEHAIEHYKQVITVQTRERSPLDFADTVNNLGNAFRARKEGSHEENIETAITCFKESLSIRLREAVPNDHRRTARNLGLLYFELGRWSEAHDMLASAIAVSETLYLLGFEQEGPSLRLREHAELVAADAYCLLQLNRPREAVQRLERGRSRAINEMLERDRLALIAVSPAERLAFQRAQGQLEAAYRAARRFVASGNSLNMPPESLNLRFGEDERTLSQRRAIEEIHAERRAAQSALEAAVIAIRKTRSDFLYPPLSFKQIAGIATKQQTLVYLAATSRGSFCIIVPAGVSELSSDYVIFSSGVTSEQIDDIVPRIADDESFDKTQLGYLPRPQMIDHILEMLGTGLMASLAQRLNELKLPSVVLIPTGRLAGLPLHAAPVGNAAPCRDDEYAVEEFRANALFLDTIEVAYAPSAQCLSAARAGSLITLKSGIAAIGNPQPASVTLDWAEHEAEAIAQVTRREGQSCNLLIRRQATGEAVIKAIKERAYIHLSCATVYYPEHLLESYIELGGGDTLKVADLFSGKVPLRGVRLIVLGAGPSGGMGANAPDESIGMAAAMLVSGASCVIASHWPANDLATLLLLRRFAEGYVDEQRPAQALRNAQRWLRSLTLRDMMRDFNADLGRDPDYNPADFAQPDDCLFAHPVYWAGFTTQGA